MRDCHVRLWRTRNDIGRMALLGVSLRGAQRRSNLGGGGNGTVRLLRYARNDMVKKSIKGCGEIATSASGGLAMTQGKRCDDE